MATEADFDRIGMYARMHNKDQGIDRHKCSRVVPMQVLALGYSRTGTLSMQKALTILGYPNCYHFSFFLDNIQDCDMWRELLDAKFEGKGKPPSKDDFDKLLGHCSAVTDMPCHLFAKELMEFYPDAKIVLVERDIDSWYKSWSSFLVDAFNPTLYYLSYLDPSWLGRVVAVGTRGVDKQVGSAKTLAAAQARSKEEYRKYYAMVRALAPKDRLLEFQLKDGWGPLCEFLGKPVPKGIDFPRLNDAKSNQQAFKELALKGLKNIVTNAIIAVTVVGVPVGAAMWYTRALRR